MRSVRLDAGCAQPRRQPLGACAFCICACTFRICACAFGLGALSAGRDDCALSVAPAQPRVFAALELAAPQHNAQVDLLEPRLVGALQPVVIERVDAQSLLTN